MKFTVTLPTFSLAADIAMVADWRKEIGDYVGEGDVLATVREGGDPDGIVSEIPAPAFGILAKKFALPGEAIEVGEPLALLSGVPTGLTNGQEAIPYPFSGPPRYIPGGPEDILILGQREQAIAKHMARSWQTSPHVYTTVAVQLYEVAQIAERTGVEPLACIIAAVAGALTRFRALNAQLVDETEIRQKRYVHIGVVRRCPEGTLYVPVLRDAEISSVRALDRELARVTEQVQTGNLAPEEMRGATFTIASATEDVLWQTPLLHQPQAALLSVGAVTRIPIALPDDTVAVRPVTHLCLAHDARLVDETTAAAFLADIKRELEEARFLFG
jgi:pyruvate/2-oxoglutarate dehydrogenase complex dihydrolipoamide acyltransferase (E2) component